MTTIDQWAVNESLLQAYRSTFISSQSFFLAVGAIFSGKNPTLVYVTAAVGLFVIGAIWWPVVFARHRIVDYYKFSARLDPAQLATLCSEDDYVNNAGLRAQANAAFGIKKNLRRTRWKLDVAMPALFTVVWLTLLYFELRSAQVF